MTVTTSAVGELSGRLADLPPRFHLDPAAPPDAITWEELLEPITLRFWLDRYAKSRHIDEPQIAASLFVETLARHLTGPTLAGPVLHGRLLRVPPGGLHVAPVDCVGGPGFRFAATDGDVEIAEGVDAAPGLLDGWASHWADGHLRDLVDAVREVQQVGERLLWGNVAAAAVAATVFLDWWAPDRDVRSLAEHLLTTGRPAIGEYARLTTLGHRGRMGLGAVRTTCCLALRLNGAEACPGCPMVSPQERLARIRVHLRHLDRMQAVAARFRSHAGSRVGPVGSRSTGAHRPAGRP